MIRNNSFSALWPAIWLSIIGSAILNLAPIFLAVATEKFQLSNRQVGFLASSELAGIALASLTTSLWLSRFDQRKLAYLGLLLIALGNLFSIFCDSLNEFFYARFIIGLFGSGIVNIIAIVTLGNTDNATKNFGLLVFSQMLFAGITLSLLPFIFLHLSLIHLLLFFCGLSLTGLLIVQFIPGQLNQTATNIPNKKAVNYYDLLALAGIFLIAFNLGSIWSYSERIGFSLGLGLQEIGTLLGISMLPQAFGAGIPTLLGLRIGYTIPLAIALCGQVVGLVILAKAENASSYLWGISLWGSCYNLGIAYKLGLISELPGKNRLLAWTPGVQCIALTSSPSFCALFIFNNDFSPVILISSIATFLGCSLFIILSFNLNKSVDR